MRFLFFVELLFGLLGIWTLVSQIIVPMLTGRPYFPWFRRSLADKENKLVELNELQDEQDLDTLLRRRQEELEKSKGDSENVSS